MGHRRSVIPHFFRSQRVVPFVQYCGFHCDQKSDIPRSRTISPVLDVVSSTVFCPVTGSPLCFQTP